MNDCCPISGETPIEERVNYITHLIGFIFSIVGWLALLLYVHYKGDPWYMVGSWIYGASLVCLYGASTFYHRCQTIWIKQKLKVLDHICIYLLIAGSYVPFALGPIRHLGGPELLAVVTVIMSVGIISKIINVNRFETLSLLLYLGLGWLEAYSFPNLIGLLPWTTLALVIAGGLFYTFGTIFYVWNAIPYNHGIWHLFVLGGSSCHYCAVFHMIYWT